MASCVYKLGVINTKPVFIGGHDLNNPIRIKLRKQIKKIIDTLLLDKDRAIIGITGLSLGLEQDFAISCVENNIDYIAYIVNENEEELWKDLPVSIREQYKNLYSKAHEIISIGSKNTYSPKENLLKMEKIIRDCDGIIILQTEYQKDNLISKKYNDKSFYYINV